MTRLDEIAPTGPAADGGPEPLLSVEVRPDRDAVIVAPRGELDLSTVALVEREVRELQERGFARVVLDLRGLTFIDSTGLRLLIRLDDDARARRHTLTLIDRDGPARHLLELTGLRNRFELRAG